MHVTLCESLVMASGDIRRQILLPHAIHRWCTSPDVTTAVRAGVNELIAQVAGVVLSDRLSSVCMILTRDLRTLTVTSLNNAKKECQKKVSDICVAGETLQQRFTIHGQNGHSPD